VLTLRDYPLVPVGFLLTAAGSPAAASPEHMVPRVGAERHVRRLSSGCWPDAIASSSTWMPSGGMNQT